MFRRTGSGRAFTILELLIVLAVTSLLVSISAPALSNMRSKAASATCLERLRQVVLASCAYASDDSGSQLLPVHPIADINELHDEGFFDYGGATGASNIWSGLRWGAQSPRSAETRPLNRVLFGASVNVSGYSLFQCPADLGLPQREYVGAGDYWDQAMESQPMHVSVGTSYWGNAYRGFGVLGDRPGKRFWSVGVFLRPVGRIPAPAETVLYGEAIAWEQLALTGNMGGGPAFTVRGLAGWHGEDRFNLGFGDGHARSVSMSNGPLYEGNDTGAPALAALQVRGEGYRFDCRPDALIEDKPD